MLLNLPPRKEYTLSQALEYLKNFHNETRINKEYLIYQAQQGRLKTVISLKGGRDFYTPTKDYRSTLEVISNHTLVDKKYFLINGETKIIATDISLKSTRELNREFDFYEMENNYLYIYFNTSKLKTMPKYPNENLIMGKKGGGEIRKIDNIQEFCFFGYFVLDPSEYEGNSVDIVQQGFICKKIYNEFEITERSETYFSFLLSYVNDGYSSFDGDFIINLDDILILHEDLLEFIGIDKRDNNEDHILEIEKLKKELEEKDKKIVELQTALEGKNFPIFLNQFMENDRLALAIQARKDYWANYDPNLNNAPKAESTAREIKEKYVLSKKQAEAIEIIACPINRN